MDGVTVVVPIEPNGRTKRDSDVRKEQLNRIRKADFLRPPWKPIGGRKLQATAKGTSSRDLSTVSADCDRRCSTPQTRGNAVLPQRGGTEHFGAKTSRKARTYFGAWPMPRRAYRSIASGVERAAAPAYLLLVTHREVGMLMDAPMDACCCIAPNRTFSYPLRDESRGVHHSNNSATR